MWNFRAFCHVYNNDNASKCQEFKADARYFYGNQIPQVSNKICACESTVLLKPLKPRSWLPAFYAKPQSWLLAVNSILEKKPPKFSIGAFFLVFLTKCLYKCPNPLRPPLPWKFSGCTPVQECTFIANNVNQKPSIIKMKI